MGLSDELHHGDVLASVRRGPALELRLVFEVTRAGNPSVCLELRTPTLKRGWVRWKAIGAIRLHEIQALQPALSRVAAAVASSRWSSSSRPVSQRRLAGL